MELQTIKCVAIPKELIRREGGGPEAHTAWGNIKNIAVPMRGDKPGGHSSPKRIVTRDRIQRDLKKTHFGVSGLHSCSESESHELSAQAQAEDRFSDTCGVADESAFVCEIGIAFLLVGSLRTPAYNQASEVNECFWHRLAKIGSNDIDGKTNAGERFAKKTRSVNIAMLDKQNPFVPHRIPPYRSDSSRSRGLAPRS